MTRARNQGQAEVGLISSSLCHRPMAPPVRRPGLSLGALVTVQAVGWRDWEEL